MGYACYPCGSPFGGPPFAALMIASETIDSSDFDGASSIAATVANAVATGGPFVDANISYSTPPSGIVGIAYARVKGSAEAEHYYTEQARRSRFKWALSSATCYGKVWWDEVTYGTTAYVFEPEVEESRTPQEWTWTPPGNEGLCIPIGYNPTGFSTWSSSSFTELEPPLPDEPAAGESGFYGSFRYVSMENVRWSFVSGYEPTGSMDNGFPAS